MTKHNLSYAEFVKEARLNNIKFLLVEITPDLPEGMRHTYAPKGERIAGCFGTDTGTWFTNPTRWETNKRKFEKVYI